MACYGAITSNSFEDVEEDVPELRLITPLVIPVARGSPALQAFSKPSIVAWVLGPR